MMTHREKPEHKLNHKGKEQLVNKLRH
uniref:Uncharacterized protein n=1 Tax=Tetranychus urticae TaxID=32264 RepID=T1KYM1_TETUR